MHKEIKNSTIKLVLKSCQTFAENIFKTVFSPNLSLFYVSAGQNTFLTYSSQQDFIVIKVHLTVTYLPKLESQKMTHPTVYSIVSV